MVQVEYIRFLYYQQHKSMRAIAREVHCSRKTIRKVLKMEDLRDYKYHLTIPRPKPVMAPYLDIIKAWLEEDKTRPGKQRHTGHRIYEQLKAEYGMGFAEFLILLVISVVVSLLMFFIPRFLAAKGCSVLLSPLLPATPSAFYSLPKLSKLLAFLMITLTFKLSASQFRFCRPLHPGRQDRYGLTNRRVRPNILVNANLCM